MSSTPETPAKMTYRFLGDSGLLVSKVSLGSWMNHDPSYTPERWFALMKTAFTHGVNLFDTAENYNDGQSEALMGAAIQMGIADRTWTREDLVISTKLFGGSKGTFAAGPNDQGTSRKHLVEGIKSSLKKLQLDYVDVLFCHRSEKFTPIEETVRAMSFIINQGWALYWGTSEWSAADISEAQAVADRLGLIRPIVEQPQYNLFERSKVEFEYADLYKKHRLGLTVWSPLAFGILTGKYNVSTPSDSRLADPASRSFFPDVEDKIAKTRELQRIADKLGCSLAQLAIAWCVSNPNVSSVLLGARTSEQLEETMAAVGLADKLTSEIKAEMDEIVPFIPKKPAPDLFYTIRERHLHSKNPEQPEWMRFFKKK